MLHAQTTLSPLRQVIFVQSEHADLILEEEPQRPWLHALPKKDASTYDLYGRSTIVQSLLKDPFSV